MGCGTAAAEGICTGGSVHTCDSSNHVACEEFACGGTTWRCTNEGGAWAWRTGNPAAAEGAIGIARSANRVRTKPLRVILNGLGKDAAKVISRINGFTYVQTQFDYASGKLNIVSETRYSEGERGKVHCYGADDVREGVAINHLEGVDVSITGNSTNPTRFQHPVAGTYKKECIQEGKKYFSVASGGGTGRTFNWEMTIDNIALIYEPEGEIGKLRFTIPLRG